MSKRIVDAFEKIDVQHHDRQSGFLHARLSHRRFKLLKKAATINEIGEEIFSRQLLEFFVHPRHRLDDKPGQHDIQRYEHQRECDQKRDQKTIERFARFLQRIEHRQLDNLHAERLVHFPVKAVLVAIHADHGRRRGRWYAVADEALPLFDDDGAGHVHGALNAFALNAGELGLCRVGAKFLDQYFFPVRRTITRIGRIQHRFLVLVRRKFVAQAAQGFGRCERGHRLRVEPLFVHRAQVRLDLVGGVAADRERGFHEHR